MWKHNLSNVNLKFGTKSILSEAKDALGALLGIQLVYSDIKDKVGRIAYRIGDAYLVGKRCPYGDIVSCHQTIWKKAKKENLDIIMYIQESKYFYRFRPAEIKTTETNLRGDMPMVNFSIREGVNIMKCLEETERVKEILRKNLKRPLTVEEAGRAGAFG